MVGNKSNIVLIGMPGAGKSTVGRWLAKQLGYQFVDGDVLIEQYTTMPIQDVVNRMGLGKFAEIEERVLCDLSFSRSIISTGGSAVYSDKAMQTLRKNSVLVYLKISPMTLIRRVNNATSRGLFKLPAHPLLRVYQHRVDLYPHYADITFDNDAPFTAVRGCELMRKIDAFF